MGSGLGLDVGSGFKLSGLPRNNQLMLLYRAKEELQGSVCANSYP